MFVALRDLRFARGRFALICSVITLITILVGFLSGLTGGLAWQNVSGVLALPFDKIVIAADDEGRPTDFSSSAITADQVAAWSGANGVTSAIPVGITQTHAESGASDGPLTLIGFDGGAGLEGDAGFDGGADAATTVGMDGAVAPGTVVLSAGAAKALDAAVGDTVSVAGTQLTVSGVGADWWYSHTPVARTSLADWHTIMSAQRQDAPFATAIAVTGDPVWGEHTGATDTVASGRLAALSAIPAFASEVGSLGMMIAMLFGISALVIGAFFTVWTIQRSGDIAVLGALGASTRTLRGDALGQAAIVLAVGIGLGTAVVVGLGTLAPAGLPFLISPLTTAVPAALMVMLGLAGAGIGVRTVTSVNPLAALGGAR